MKCVACGGAGVLGADLREIMEGKPQQRACDACNGTGRVQYRQRVRLWNSHRYFFQMLYEKPRKEHISGLIHFGGTKRAGGANRTYSGRPYEGPSPLGRHKRTVWTVSTSKLAEAHYAPFPTKLIKPMIQAGCPRYVCTKCGLPTFVDHQVLKRVATCPGAASKHAAGDARVAAKRRVKRRVVVGARKIQCKCSCGAPFRRGRVLDPFGGSGTTGRAAAAMGRDWLCIELKSEYVDIARRITDEHSVAAKLDAYTLPVGHDKQGE
jgi:hypothetical protein